MEQLKTKHWRVLTIWLFRYAINEGKRSGFDSKTIECHYLGPAIDGKGDGPWNPKTRRVFHSRNAGYDSRISRTIGTFDPRKSKETSKPNSGNDHENNDAPLMHRINRPQPIPNLAEVESDADDENGSEIQIKFEPEEIG